MWLRSLESGTQHSGTKEALISAKNGWGVSAVEHSSLLAMVARVPCGLTPGRESRFSSSAPEAFGDIYITRQKTGRHPPAFAGCCCSPDWHQARVTRGGWRWLEEECQSSVQGQLLCKEDGLGQGPFALGSCCKLGSHTPPARGWVPRPKLSMLVCVRLAHCPQTAPSVPFSPLSDPCIGVSFASLKTCFFSHPCLAFYLSQAIWLAFVLSLVFSGENSLQWLYRKQRNLVWAEELMVESLSVCLGMAGCTKQSQRDAPAGLCGF